MTFEDELQNGLHAAGDSIQVADAASAAIERRARQRSTRNRALAGLGAAALVAGAIGGTFALTGDDPDVIDTATASTARDGGESAELATGDDTSATSSRLAGAPGEVNMGVIPIEWEILEPVGAPQLFDVRISGDRVFAQNNSGWISTSTDMVDWTSLAVPAELADPDRFGGVAGWVNAFDVRGDVIVAAVEVFDGQPFTEEEFAAREEDGLTAFDPCRDGGAEGRTLVARSNDAGATWTVSELRHDRPEGRFHGGNAVPWVATDGSTVLVGEEIYRSLNVECVLQDAGVDVDAIHREGGGYGWDAEGVQVYAGWEDDSDEERFEERIIATYPWDELALTAEELAAVTGDFEREGQTTLRRLDEDGTTSIIDLDGRQLGNLIGLDGEFLVMRWDGRGATLLRSTDSGLTWAEEEFDGFIRSVRGDRLLRDSENGRSFGVSTDGGRTWTDVAAPPGTWVQDMAVLGDVVIATGESSEFFGPSEEDFGTLETFEQTASLDGYSITIRSDEGRFALTMVEEATGTVLIDDALDIEQMIELDGADGADFGFMRFDEEMNVTFVDGDGNDIATFTEAQMDAAFDGGEARASGASGSVVLEEPAVVVEPAEPVAPSSDGDLPVAPQPLIDCDDDADCTAVDLPASDFERPDVLISYRGADGVWISQPVSEIVGESRWAQTVFTLGDAIYVVLEPDYEVLEAPPEFSDSEGEAAFDERMANPQPLVLVARP